MTLDEYNAAKNMNYNAFCEYLKAKYGIATEDYYLPGFVRNNKVSRTREGLFAHHVMEDRAILLSTREVAMTHPMLYQSKENLVYCDWVEHLYLHLLIAENPAPDAEEGVGIGGCVSFLVPQLNDVFAGFRSDKEWEQNCINKVFDEETGFDAYMAIVARLKVHLAKLLTGDSSVIDLDALNEHCNYYLCSSAHEEDSHGMPNQAFVDEYGSRLESFIYEPIRNMPTGFSLPLPGLHY